MAAEEHSGVRDSTGNTVLRRTTEYQPPRSWRTWLIGRPLPTADAPHQTIGKAVGLAVFASDALSSTAYATQEILVVLVDVALNQAEILTSLIEEEMSLGDMMTLLKLCRGQYSLVEEKIPSGAKAVGVAIQDLGLPDQCTIAAIIRKGKIVVPRGSTILEEGDEVFAVTDRRGAEQLAALFAPPDLPGQRPEKSK